MKRILFHFTLCLLLLSCLGCKVSYDNGVSEKYQDVARVDIVKYINSNIDSVVMKVNDSITGCYPSIAIYDNMLNISDNKVVGSITHGIQFPINVRLQLFSHGYLQKELFFEMDKNTVARVYKGSDCPKDIDSSLDDYCWLMEKLEDPYDIWCCVEDICTIGTRMEHKRFIDSSLTDNYCWLLEKMGDSYDHERCTELSVDGKQELCDLL